MNKGFGGVIALPTISKANLHSLIIQTVFVCFCTIFLLVLPLVVMAGAGVWAVAGLLRLPSTLTLVLALVVGVPTLWASIAAAILVFNTETEASSYVAEPLALPLETGGDVEFAEKRPLPNGEPNAV